MRLSEKLTKGERFIYCCTDGQIDELKIFLLQLERNLIRYKERRDT